MQQRSFFDITDPGDPRVAPYTRVRERDLTGRGDRFIVEGKVTLDVLLTRSRFEVESLLLCDTRLAPLGRLLETVPAEVPVFTASQSVMDEIAGFPIHRGILACARKGPALAAADITGQPGPLVVAIGLSNHDNVGALFRNAAAFGACGILLDETSCDPLYRKAIRVSAGTSLWLPFAHGQSGCALLDLAASAGFTPLALTPDTEAISLYAMPREGRVAVIVGAEGPGLSHDILAMAQSVCIPMHHGVDSLNVATAAAIALSWLQATER
ncbi:MAG: RNA methyltransferase [Pseudomonadota bacterium]